jgi:membrane fusion protein, protease secretion system
MTASTDTQNISKISKEITSYRNLGLGFVLFSFFLFVVWSAWAPLDEGVPAMGQVSIDTKRKAVQHPIGGVVAEVLIKEGDHVAAGAPLIRLDVSAARANLETVRQRYHSLLATQGRLMAERNGSAQPEWPEQLKNIANDPLVSAHIRTQTDLLQARRAGLLAEQQAARQSIAGLEAQMAASRAALPLRQTQHDSLQSELKALHPLIDAGYVPKNRQRELERQINDISVALSELNGQLARLAAAKSETQQRMLAREADWRKETQTLLADVTRDVQADAQRILAVQEELDRTDITAPVAGQVVGLGYQTVGGVIPPGQKIMDIVPLGDGLVIETRVPPPFIDRVKQGTAVDIRFTTFAHTPQLVVEGVVLSVSADSLADPQTGQTYFLARVGLTPDGLKTLGQRELQPGMTTEVVFMTGERSLLSYLLHPLTKRLAASMKEE